MFWVSFIDISDLKYISGRHLLRWLNDKIRMCNKKYCRDKGLIHSALVMGSSLNYNSHF